MKSILITKENVDMLASRYNVEPEDVPERLPLGYVLIGNFGVDEHFEVVTKEFFDSEFVVVQSLLNGFSEIRRS